MSGTNQASNLSGLFAGFDTKLQDPKMFNRGIENTFRPDFGTSENGLLEAAAWESKMGRAPEANALTAAAQQKVLAREADLKAAGGVADPAFFGTIQSINQRMGEAVAEFNPEKLTEAEADYAKLVPINTEQGRAYNTVKPEQARTALTQAMEARDLKVMAQHQDVLDAEMEKPAGERNEALIDNLGRSLSQWREKTPEETKHRFDQIRAERLDRKEQERSAAEAQKLTDANKLVTKMWMEDNDIDQIKEKIAPMGIDIEALSGTFSALESVGNSIEKIKTRENTKEAVATAKTEVLAMVDTMTEMTPENRERLRGHIVSAMSVADLLPNEALNRAEYFMKQMAQFNMGVEQDRLREYARAEGDFRSLVNQLRIKPMTTTERDSAMVLLSNLGVQIGEGGVPFSDVGKVAASMRMSNQGLPGWGYYKTDANGDFVVKNGALVPLSDSEFKNVNTKNRKIYDDASAEIPQYITNPNNLVSPVGSTADNPIIITDD